MVRWLHMGCQGRMVLWGGVGLRRGCGLARVGGALDRCASVPMVVYVPTHSQTNASVLGSQHARAGPNRSPPKKKKKMMKKHQLQLWTERRSFPRFPKVRLRLPESLELVNVGCKKQFVMTEL